MTREDYVTCMVCDNCIRMSRGIAQKLSHLSHCVLSWVCLLCDNRPQSRKHGVVNTLCIIEESANDLLDDFFVFLGEQCQRVSVFSLLCLCSVVGFVVRVWLMLWFVGCSVLELCEGLGDVVDHQAVDPAAIVVPIHVHAKVVLSVPGNGAFVVFVEIFCEMFGVLPPNLLDAKVVDTESE
jgi:hypothetical protein